VNKLKNRKRYYLKIPRKHHGLGIVLAGQMRVSDRVFENPWLRVKV